TSRRGRWHQRKSRLHAYFWMARLIDVTIHIPVSQRIVKVSPPNAPARSGNHRYRVDKNNLLGGMNNYW
ncbi:MAG: hypothetical protein U9Q82_09440, partial [Chloroflexota bacterium]|nr:hypothetical protein [Chloroflexota bacterium]